MLKNSPVVRNALKEEEKVDVLKYPVKRKEYTVLLPKTFPAINHEIPLNWRYLDEVPVMCKHIQYILVNNPFFKVHLVNVAQELGKLFFAYHEVNFLFYHVYQGVLCKKAPFHFSVTDETEIA